VPFGWVTADEAYGQVKYLRVWLERHEQCLKHVDDVGGVVPSV
jgi:hypothetical protein